MFLYFIFFQVTTSIIMETLANDFVPLNALKTKSNVDKLKLLQDACKTISASTGDSMIITSSVMGFVQLNAKMMNSSVQMILPQPGAPSLKIVLLNRKITKETFAPTNNAHSNVPKPDICVKEVLMNTDARKKMYAF